MADDRRLAKRKLEAMLMTLSGHRRDLERYRAAGSAAGVGRCERALRIDYALIRKHCAEHELDLPHDVPSEDSK